LSEAKIYSLSPAQIVALARNPRPKPAKCEPIRAHSKLFDELFTVDRGNEARFVTFESGPTFSKKEIELLQSEKNPQAIKALFTIKKSFGGTVEKDAENGCPKFEA
jgi:hypothetical protein